MDRLTRRVATRVLPMAFLIVVALATPADAHGIGGTEPTNYETTISGVEPPVAGLRVEVTDLGTRLRLTNRTGRDVTVLGYDGEPYLRIGPRGVFENRRSPATYLNRDLRATTEPPASADPDARPQWRRVSDGRAATWHDHRAHYMGTRVPPVVRADPDHRHVLDRWVVALRTGGQTVEVRGTLAWDPPPSPWPWVALVVVAAALVAGLSRTRAWRAVLTSGLGALVLCALVHALGHWGAGTAGTVAKLGESVYSIAGIALGLLALVWIARRGVEAAVPSVLVAAVFLLIAGGLADLATIGHSQVPSSLAPGIARLAVALTIGLGGGLAIAAVLRLRAPAFPRAGPAQASSPRSGGERSPVTS